MVQEKTYVYFIQRSKGCIKIGISSDPDKRMKQLQTGAHEKLRLLCLFPFKSRSEAMACEKQLHEQFKPHRKEGEWFQRSILRTFKKRSTLFPMIFSGTGKKKLWEYNENPMLNLPTVKD